MSRSNAHHVTLNQIQKPKRKLQVVGPPKAEQKSQRLSQINIQQVETKKVTKNKSTMDTLFKQKKFGDDMLAELSYEKF